MGASANITDKESPLSHLLSRTSDWETDPIEIGQSTRRIAWCGLVAAGLTSLSLVLFGPNQRAAGEVHRGFAVMSHSQFTWLWAAALIATTALAAGLVGLCVITSGFTASGPRAQRAIATASVLAFVLSSPLMVLALVGIVIVAAMLALVVIVVGVLLAAVAA